MSTVMDENDRIIQRLGNAANEAHEEYMQAMAVFFHSIISVDRLDAWERERYIEAQNARTEWMARVSKLADELNIRREETP